MKISYISGGEKGFASETKRFNTYLSRKYIQDSVYLLKTLMKTFYELKLNTYLIKIEIFFYTLV